MGSVLTDLVRGVGTAALTVLLALVLPSPLRVPIVGVLLGVAAGVYPGFAQSGAGAGSPPPPSAAETRLQWIVALLFAAIAVVGIALSTFNPRRKKSTTRRRASIPGTVPIRSPWAVIWR